MNYIQKICVLLSLFSGSLSIKAVENSPYISDVYSYLPAPGQFTNVLPAYEEGDDAASMAAKVEAKIAGVKNGGLVTLGAYGGSVVVGFDHSILNLAGQTDFGVYGNAYANSSEPAVVMVSVDDNENGLPDDTWYELAGSEYSNSITGYEITYFRPVDDADDVKWTDNQEDSSFINKNTFHTQAYYPLWIGPELFIEGTLLPDNGIQNATTHFYELPAFAWGYADNYPNADDRVNMNIDWAVNADGTPAVLSQIDFVKVYCGVQQVNGWLGECSTEIAGMMDLHPDAVVTSIEENTFTEAYRVGDRLCNVEAGAQVQVYSPSGRMLANFEANEAVCVLPSARFLIIRIETEDGVQIIK